MEVKTQNQYCCVPPQASNVAQTQCCSQIPIQNQQIQSVQSQPVQTSPQTYQIPASTSGVNIQIFNPAVTAPGAQAPTYNVNSPCYPSNYYTNQYGKEADGIKNSGNSGMAGVNGSGESNSGSSVSTGGQSGQNNQGQNTSTAIAGSSGSSTETISTDKSEKKHVIQLTDQYIMNLENYLNSQDKNIRLYAAQEVYNRLDEDPSRKNDKALTALINKMLQDPSQEIRVIALSALEGRIVSGDDKSAELLKNMQTKPDAYGQDAIDASKILLQMSAKPVEKVVEVDPMKKTTVKVKTESKTEETKKE